MMTGLAHMSVWGHYIPLRSGISFVAGGLTVLALPPFSWLIAVPVAFSALFLILRQVSTAHAFFIGWVFGIGQFGFGISWIAESFYVDAERFAALAIPAVAGLSAGLAIFPAMAAALYAVIAQRRPLGGIAASLLLATCWVATEWLRGHVLTGFPWNLAAYALVDHAALRQPAAWVGSYGLSFLTVLVGVMPGAAYSAVPRQRVSRSRVVRDGHHRTLGCRYVPPWIRGALASRRPAHRARQRAATGEMGARKPGRDP